MKDNPFMWQPLFDYVFQKGFEKKVLISVCVIAILSIFSVSAELYHDQRPEYADSDFMKPEEMIMLEQLELFQIIVIAAMLAVTVLKVFGTYLAIKYNTPTLVFNPAFIVSGLLGVFVGYVAYMGSSPAMDATYIDIFMQAGFYALSANLMFDFAGKVKGKIS